MAVYHRARAFQRHHVQRIFDEMAAAGPESRNETLLARAREAFAGDNPSSKQFLQDLCVDETTFDTSEADLDLIENWLIIAVSSTFRASSNLGGWGFPVLRCVLPHFGWETSKVECLLNGRCLYDFVASFNSTDVLKHISQTPTRIGWLGGNDIAEASLALDSIREAFLCPDSRIIDLIAGNVSQEFPRDSIRGDRGAVMSLQETYDQIQWRLGAARAIDGELIIYND